jgi:shikimate dehydrogenase
VLRFAVIGDPVEHSRSPRLHAEFYAQSGLAARYDAIRVPKGECAAALARLRDEGYFGLNVTTPLKEEAFALCARADETSRRAGAVNTLTLLPALTEGANTDGIGARAALEAALGEPVRERTILILGAGPTARAAALELAARGARLRLWNRTPERWDALRADLGADPLRAGEPLDAVLSTLPPGAAFPPPVRDALLGARAVVDANYGDRATLRAMLGREVTDGSEMLAAQARASFESWKRCAEFTKRA